MKGHRLFAALYDFCGRLSEKQMRPHRAFAAGGARGRVLEIGCGTGANFAFYDWDKVESLEAVEPDPFMLARARKKIEAGTAAKVTLQEAPAEALPFPDASFDTAVATLVLCTVRDPAAAAAELRRVLKPGGSLRLVEHVRANGRWSRFQDFVQPVYGWMAAGCVMGRNTELTLTAAGFRVVVQERFTFGPPMPAFAGIAYLP